MKNLTYKSIFIIILLTPTLVQAQFDDDEQNLIGYDSIVSELSQVRANQVRSSDPFDNVVIHAGVGFVTSMVNIPQSGVKDVTGFLQGYQATLGIDLLSPRWVAEGSVRSFGEEKIDQSRVSLQEFDLKIAYLPYRGRLLKIRGGIGLAARYLVHKHRNAEANLEEKFTTPSSVFFLGGNAYLTPNISLGTEISFRSSMIDETDDDQAFDATFKIDAHF